MDHSYTVIDVQNWERKTHFGFYQTFQNPFYNLTADVDITNAVKYAKSKKLPVFLAYYHAAIQAVNQIPQLKVRMVDGELRQYYTIHMGSTFLYEDETFTFCSYPYHEDIEKFFESGLEVIEMMRQQKKEIAEDPQPNLVYSTIVPWVIFTSLQHPYKHSQEDLIPRLSFGKFYELQDKIMIPFSAHIHHGIADGIHVGRLFQYFEGNCRKLKLHPQD